MKPWDTRLPWQNATASLKQGLEYLVQAPGADVFRGRTPRPH